MPDTLARPIAASAEIHPVQAMVRFLRAVRYRKGVVVLCLAVAGLLGGLYYATTPRVYESKASLLVLQTGPDNWSPEMSGGRAAQDLMDTYRNMVGSEAVLENALALLLPEDRADLEDVPRAKWIETLQRNLSVTAVRRTNILQAAYRSKKPRSAAAVVGAVLSAYLEFMDKLHKSTSREILDILTREKAGLEEQLRAKESELLAVRSRAGELVIRGENQGINVVVKRAMSLNEALIAAHEKRLEAQSLLAAVEAAVRNGEDLQQHALAMADAVGREMLLQRLGLSSSDANTAALVNQQLLEDRAKLQSSLQLYGPAHRKVLEIQQRIAAAEDYLQRRHQLDAGQLRGVADRELGPMLQAMAQQRLQQALAHENSVYASYEQEKGAAIALDQTMARLEILDLDINRLRRFYDIVLQRVKDVNLSQENGILRTSVLSRPEVPIGPVWPRPSMVAILSLILGLGAGLMVVYLQDLLDDHFRSPEELRTQLGLPVLAMIHRMEPIADQGIGAVQAHVKPNAVETEAFRTLRTALALAEGGAERLVVSSSEPGDGKTTVAVNLAVAFAQSGKRTLLIDADMRRPGLTPLLELRGHSGLSTTLRDETPVAQAAAENLCAGLAPNLDVLPSGPRPINPTELLAGDRFSELLGWAEARYDQIVIDSPPAMVSDTAIIGRLVDGVLLTVQPEKNRRRVVIRAAESFAALGIRVLGIVVNRLALEKDRDYYGYEYGYGYGYGYGGGDDGTEEQNDADQPAEAPARIVRKAA